MITGSIVLFKNDRNILLNAIHSFLNLQLDQIKLYLIDNSPTDDLKDIIIDPRVVYLHNSKNTGFGAGHNIALKNAIEISANYHLVLNPDVYYFEGVLEALLEYMDRNLDVGNLMPKVLYPDGSLQFLCKLLPTPYDWIGRRFNPIKSLIDKRNEIFEMRFTNYDKEMDVPYLSGCFMFLRMDAIKKIGLFDEKIFMYGEETDLCRRLISGGYRTVFYPNVSIYHHFEKGSHKSWRLTRIGVQSAIYYFNKWGWFFDRERKAINKKTIINLK